MAIIPGTLTTLSGQSTLTGSFSTIYALADTDISISGSNIGSTRFVMPKGMKYESALGEGVYSVQNYISRVEVNNTYGSVLVVTGAEDSLS
jgi:hypothetical protein